MFYKNVKILFILMIFFTFLFSFIFLDYVFLFAFYEIILIYDPYHEFT